MGYTQQELDVEKVLPPLVSASGAQEGEELFQRLKEGRNFFTVLNYVLVDFLDSMM